MTLARKTQAPTTQLKQRTIMGMRALAGRLDEQLPGMAAPQHLRDAARALSSGNHAGAKRHLMAAMHTMTPTSLMRHGVLDDDGHSKGKVAMDLINRHHLLVSDLEDAEAHNANRATPATFTQPSNLPMGRSMNPLDMPGPAGNGPGAPKSVQAAMVPAPKQNTGTDRAMAGGPKAPSRPEKQLPGRPMPAAVLSWSDVDRLIELSATEARDAHGRWVKGLRFSVKPNGVTEKRFKGIDEKGNTVFDEVPYGHRITAYHRGKEVGHLDWNARDGGVDMVKTDEKFRDRGVATHMFDRAREYAAENNLAMPNTEHAIPVTTAGLGWTHAMLQKNRPGSETIGQVPLFPRKGSNKTTTLANILEMIELSAQTGRLAATPAPYGRPGGPGLYGVRGNKHSDYFEQIVKALMEKRGMDKGRASAVAWGVLRKWSRGGGHVHPEVRAAAAGALAKEGEARARAHGHSLTWDDVVRQIELTGTAAGAAQDPRIPLGQSGGGQFGAGGAASASGKGMSAQQKAAQKATLLAQAAADRALASAYAKMLMTLQKAKASTAKKAAAATAAATKAGTTGKSASTTPAKKTVAAKTPAAIASANFKKATAGMSKDQQVGWLQQEIKSTLAQAAALTKQAGAL